MPDAKVADEHFIPGSSRITEIESFHRYFAAAELCRDCSVLDAASGDGYGSSILAKKARTVTGIDHNEDAVINADKAYHAQNLEFLVGNVQKMPFPDASFDRVVSFETIEHISDPACFIAEIRRILKPDGILILSSPNKKAFDRRNHCAHGENPYHIHEMERDELEAMLRQFFPNISFYAQDAFYNSVISGDGGFCCYVRNKSGDLLAQSGIETPQYTILCASAGNLPKTTDSIFVDAVFDSAYGYCFDDEAVVNQFGLRGEFEKVQKELQTKERQVADTLSQLDNYKAELDNIGAAMHEGEVCRKALQENLDKAHAELQTSEDKCKALQSDFNKVYTELQNSEEHRKYMLFDLEKAHADLQTGEEKRKNLLAELDNAHTELQTGEEKRKALLAELDNAHTELQTGEEKRKTLLAELDNAHADLQMGEEKRNALLAELDNAHTELHAGEEKRKTLLAELDGAHTELHAGEEKRKTLLAELDSAHTELHAGEEKRNFLLTELDKAHTELQNGENKRNDLLTELDKAHTELQNGENKRNELLTELDKAHTELQDGENKRKDLLVELDKAHTDLQTGEEKRNFLLTELDKAHTELQDGENKRKILLGELSDAQAKLQNGERQRKSLQEKFNNVLTDFRNGEEQRKSLLSELSRTHAELQNVEERRKTLLSELTEAHTALQNGEGQRKTLLSELNKAYMELEAGDKKRQSLQEELVKHRTELRVVNERQSTLQKELEKTRLELQECEQKRKALQADLEAAHTKLQTGEEQRNSLQIDLEAARAELHDGEKCRKLLQADLEAARAGLHNGEKCRETLQADLEAARVELHMGERCRKSLQSDIEKLSAELHDGEEKRKELQSDIEKLSAELHDGEEKRKELQSDIEKLRAAFNEEHAKSEYLYYIYNELKKSWALRTFGRFAIRKRIGTAVQSVGQMSYQTGERIFSKIPCSFQCRQNCRDYLYTHFSGILQNVKDYREWHLKQEVQDEFLEQGDTGLIVPADVPLTSIIIPVYNNLKLTRECICSIYRIRSKSPFEIIVVDDCSTEDIASIKKDFPDVKIIRNEKNSGFLLTSNRGGAEASGEYLIFLNNDTEVLPGWLDELTTALYYHPEAGMIGSQLIHRSTRKLQESGNLICKNGEMLPLGRGETPDHPEFNFFREVDFSSAASIILRKKVFDEMHGFDTAYVPAYFEDPDLGLRMQKAGYKNYVMPLSRLLHQEMASYGTVLDERCQKNRKFFNDRWHDYLQKHSLYETPASMQQMRQYARPRLLYIDAEVPMADRGSGGMDAIFFMEYFIKRGYDVVFHGEYTPGYVSKYTTILLRMGVECVYLPYRKIWEYLASAGWMFHTVFVSRIYQARCFDRLLKKHCPQASYIFDTVDVHFVREILEAKLHKSDKLLEKAMTTKKYELQAAAAADATIVISNDELKLLKNEYHLDNVWHIPQARDIFGLAPNQNRHGAVFIGSAHPPNMDGLRYFHDEILPLLPQDFRLTIIGESLKKVMSESREYKDLLDCRQYNFVGFVQDLGTVLNHALMTVAPLRYGAGTKGKVASSMAYGIPCVSSKFGTEGTGMVHRENILIAATPKEFANAIMELSKDRKLWKKISDGGIEFLRRNYSKDSVEAKMDALMAHVSAHRQESHWASTPVIPKEEEEAAGAK